MWRRVTKKVNIEDMYVWFDGIYYKESSDYNTISFLHINLGFHLCFWVSYVLSPDPSFIVAFAKSFLYRCVLLPR